MARRRRPPAAGGRTAAADVGGGKEWVGSRFTSNKRQQPPGKPVAWHTSLVNLMSMCYCS